MNDLGLNLIMSAFNKDHVKSTPMFDILTFIKKNKLQSEFLVEDFIKFYNFAIDNYRIFYTFNYEKIITNQTIVFIEKIILLINNLRSIDSFYRFSKPREHELKNIYIVKKINKNFNLKTCLNDMCISKQKIEELGEIFKSKVSTLSSVDGFMYVYKVCLDEYSLKGNSVLDCIFENKFEKTIRIKDLILIYDLIIHNRPILSDEEEIYSIAEALVSGSSNKDNYMGTCSYRLINMDDTLYDAKQKIR